jgi:phosphoribosylamine--glycine ligase
LLDTDLIEIMEDCIAGRLRPETVCWRAGAALGVVLAAAGYPGTPRHGDPISLPPVEDGVYLFHAGTALRDGEVVTAGGRVLTVVGEGPSLEVARERAYAYADRIHFAGKQMRHDIGWRSLGAASGRG